MNMAESLVYSNFIWTSLEVTLGMRKKKWKKRVQ
jgi:hypothetical protein